MSDILIDPFSGTIVNRDPQPVPSLRNNKPVEIERGTINVKDRADKSGMLNLPFNYVEGCAEEFEKHSADPKIRG